VFHTTALRIFEYLKNLKALQAWEKSNMLAKYFVTTAGVKLARVRDSK